MPDVPVIALRGSALRAPSQVGLAELARLDRSEIIADFHCVAGWSATDLRWEGVRFADFYRRFVEPALSPGVTVTHLVFEGLDGVAAVVAVEDALRDDVLLADRLNGRPLGGDHGAPLRLVSPAQYGYVNIKHLCLVEVCSGLPTHRLGGGVLDWLIEAHPRARVWHEERHRRVSGRLVRPLYRALIRPIRYLCAKGARGE